MPFFYVIFDQHALHLYFPSAGTVSSTRKKASSYFFVRSGSNWNSSTIYVQPQKKKKWNSNFLVPYNNFTNLTQLFEYINNFPIISYYCNYKKRTIIILIVGWRAINYLIKVPNYCLKGPENVWWRGSKIVRNLIINRRFVVILLLNHILAYFVDIIIVWQHSNGYYCCVIDMADTRPIRVRLEEALVAVPRNKNLITYLQTERNAEIARETGNNCAVFIMWFSL